MNARRQAATTAPMPRGFTHWISRLVLALAALAVLAMPFYAGWEYYTFRRDVTPQVAPPELRLDRSTQADWHGEAAKLPDTAAPVVLTFHDINPHSDSPYIITPQAFDEQLTALEDAGYRSLTTDEFVDYLKGGPAPLRSVYMTFDDGTNGLWVYGDRILAKHHMHAASYLITGRVDHNRPYYLSWEEISRMASSGRWDFQDHTHDLHWRGAVDAEGAQASALANRLWLADKKRIETVGEYQTRFQGDIAQSLADFDAHGLPKPQMFAYPFSETSERANLPVPGPSLQGMLEQTFAATLTDVSKRPLPAGRRAAGVRQVQRLEVYQKTTAKSLLAEIGQWTLVPPVADDALAKPDGWEHNDGTNGKDIGALTGAGPYPSTGGYVSAEYLPLTSADWNDYTAETTVSDLADSDNNVGLTVRTGSGDPLTVSLSRSFVGIYRGTGDKREQVATKPLVATATHQLKVTVNGSLTKVLVDGRTELSWTSKAQGTEATGGVGLSVRKGAASLNWPKFTGLKIAQTPPSTTAGNPSALGVAQAVLLDPGASWDSAPGQPSGMKIGGDGLAPQGLALSDYAAYEQARTSGWTKYTVHGVIGRLNSPQVSAAVWVRVGSPQAVSVEVSRRGVRVLSGSADSRKVVATKPLADSDHHDIVITVGSEATWITVDGTVHLQLAAKGETGGVAFSAYRDVTRHAWPTAKTLKVLPATEVR
ncbi:polysaccharide deacetylase family protein [Kitasatospora sp. McL0602]|uniref:polysaccharide deacetylase family protein n=1 Tax=Kitasatospora sp. McL0602 TaxID=3439530 RepID=UPI003F8B4D26